MKKIFIICSVRGMSEEYCSKLEKYVSDLESKGNIVHLPHRDTNQNSSGLGICIQNMIAIKEANEVHIFYSSKSQGTHFDMGVAFALNKPIIIVENEVYGEGKSFARMIDEWAKNIDNLYCTCGNPSKEGSCYFEGDENLIYQCGDCGKVVKDNEEIDE
jgi:hypothetical protein